MSRLLVVLLRCCVLSILCCCVIGCGNSNKFPLAKTEGVVLCEGNPVPFVMVYFVPVSSGTSANIGKSGQAVTGEDGTFSISTYDVGDGAVIAKHNVRIAASLETGKDCPADLSTTKVVTTVDVVKGNNNFKIEVPKRNLYIPLVLPE